MKTNASLAFLWQYLYTLFCGFLALIELSEAILQNGHFCCRVLENSLRYILYGSLPFLFTASSCWSLPSAFWSRGDTVP